MPIKTELPKPRKPNPIKLPPIDGGFDLPKKPKSPAAPAQPSQPPANQPKSESDFYRQYPPDEGYGPYAPFVPPELPSINPRQDYGGALDPSKPRVLNKTDRALEDQEMYKRLDRETALKNEEMFARLDREADLNMQGQVNPLYNEYELDRMYPNPNEPYLQHFAPTQPPQNPFPENYPGGFGVPYPKTNPPTQVDPDVPDFNEYETERSQPNSIQVPPNYDKPNEPNFISPPPNGDIDVYKKPNIKAKLPPLRPPPL